MLTYFLLDLKDVLSFLVKFVFGHGLESIAKANPLLTRERFIYQPQQINTEYIVTLVEYPYLVQSMFIDPDGVFDVAHSFEAEGLFQQGFIVNFDITQQLLYAVFVHKNMGIFEQILRNDKRIAFIIIIVVFLVEEVTGLTVDEKEEFVFEFMGGAGVDPWKVEAGFPDVQIGNLEFIANRPLSVVLGEKYNRMHLGCECDELSFEGGSSEDGGYFVVQSKAVFNCVGIIDGSKIKFILLHEYPLPLFYYKGIEEGQLSIVENLYLFDDLACHIDVVDFICAYSDYRFPVFLLWLPLGSLVVVDVEEGQILGFLVADQGVSLMGDDPVRVEGEYYYLGLLDGVAPALDVGAENVEIISKGEGLEILQEVDLGLADVLEGLLVVQVDIVIIFLDDVGVVVGVLVYGLDIGDEQLYFGGYSLHLYFFVGG